MTNRENLRTLSNRDLAAAIQGLSGKSKGQLLKWLKAPCSVAVTKERPDMVNHPPHYEAGGFDCIDVMVTLFGKEETSAFCKLNTFKYIWRHKLKGGRQDLQKAKWYLDKHLSLADDDLS